MTAAPLVIRTHSHQEDPIWLCLGGTSQSTQQLGTESEGDIDVHGLTQHEGGCTAERQLATDSGFSMSFLRKYLLNQQAQGCLRVL